MNEDARRLMRLPNSWTARWLQYRARHAETEGRSYKVVVSWTRLSSYGRSGAHGLRVAAAGGKEAVPVHLYNKYLAEARLGSIPLASVVAGCHDRV